MKALSLRGLVNAIGLIVALATATSIPAGYFAIGYTNIASVLDFKAELNAGYLAKYIYTHDTLWQYQRLRLSELLGETEGSDKSVRKRVRDAAGRLVVEQGEYIATPVLMRSSPIVVAGEAVGRVEVETSLRQLFRGTAVAAAFSFLLGFGMYFAVRVFPLRVLDQTLGALHSTNRRFDAAINNMPLGLCMYDADDKIVVCNSCYGEMYGLKPEYTQVGTSFRTILEHRAKTSVPLEAADDFVERRLAVVRESDEQRYTVQELTDGRVIAISYRSMAVGWISTHEDITERRQVEARIAYLAHTDVLTELPNRVTFREDLERALARVEPERPLALLCLDLDHFKSVNDTLGHPVGDLVLQEVARRLRSAVGHEDIVARLGGDEFAVVQAGEGQPAGSIMLATRLIDAMAEPFDVQGHQVVISTAVGISLAPLDGTDADRLMKNAEMALYRAKDGGRATYRFFESEMDARMQARRALEIDLRKAVALDQFELFYQPLINLATDEVSGFEALLRWHHPQHGMIVPAEFIPLAEEIGVIRAMGAWVLGQACNEAMRWPDHIKVAVNLSPVQFEHGTLVLDVAAALGKSGLPARRLELEITEKVLLEDTEATLSILNQLRDLGVQISMDDFGTGYSSLGYLRKFPFDKIKIDQSFIRDMSAREDSMAIVRAVMSLGASLKMSVTAEGVETDEQLSRLRDEGCTEVQGYLFSRPQPATELAALLQRLKPAAKAVA
jgi:diguanylate cyclase (GGDEF)-like protein/PAS domain S-box-containing protein